MTTIVEAMNLGKTCLLGKVYRQLHFCEKFVFQGL